MVKNLSAYNAREPVLWIGKIPGKEMTIHSSIFARIDLWQRSLAGSSPWDHKELDTTDTFTTIHQK